MAATVTAAIVTAATAMAATAYAGTAKAIGHSKGNSNGQQCGWVTLTVWQWQLATLMSDGDWHQQWVTARGDGLGDSNDVDG